MKKKRKARKKTKRITEMWKRTKEGVVTNNLSNTTEVVRFLWKGITVGDKSG